MSNSGGSSPFLESPDYQEKEVVDAVFSDKDDEIRNMKYHLNTIQNEFEIEKICIQRQYNTIDKQYKTNLDTLEKTLDSMQELYSKNEKLQEYSNELKNQFEFNMKEKDIALSTLQSDFDVQKEECEFLRTQYESIASNSADKEEHSKLEAEATHTLLKRYEEEISKQINQVNNLQKELNEKEEELENVKANKITKSHYSYNTEELQELTTINKLMKDQVQYSKKLEEANMQQANEIKQLRLTNESQQHWQTECEKLTFQLQNHRGQLQILELENVKLSSQLASWEVYSENESPDNIIRELKLIKLECKHLNEDNKKLRLDLNNIKVLNDELALERNQSLDLQNNYETAILNLKRLNHELEQQKLLSFEESKLLRKQLNNNSRSLILNNNEFNKSKKEETLKGFDNMVDDYKLQTEDLTNELKKLNDQLLSQEPIAKKRRTSDQVSLNYSKRLNEYQVENLKLSENLSKVSEVNKLLEEKLKKLENLKEKSIRILQLRDSPLIKEQFVKKKQLELLRIENRDLLEIINTSSVNNLKTVPRSVFESLSMDLKQHEEEIFKINKRFFRLKEMFNKKSLEFIDVVNSLLGFKLEFQQDGRVKIFSCFKPDKYIIADLIENTLKSNLNADIEDWSHLIQIWVAERNQIPCFLATLTLMLWEKSNKE